MKKKLFIISAFVLGALLFASCTKDNGGSKKDDPTDPDPKEKKDPDITITEKFSGTIKVGYPATINIKGEGFDEETDAIFIGWNDADTLAVEYQYDNPSIEIRAKRISFGLDAYSAARNKTVKVYLEREGYNTICISDDIKVTEPEVSEGYIPDQQFRADLTIKNPSVEAMFSSLNLLDVEAAKKLEREPNPGEGWPFDISWAISDNWSGMELFESLGSSPVNDTEKGEGMNLVAWFSPNIKEVDCTNWLCPAKLRLSACSSLTKFVCGPNMFGAVLEDNPELKYVDMHLSNKATWLVLGGAGATVEYLDIRHCQKGQVAVDFPDPDADYWPNCESGSLQFSNAIKSNCLIKIDSYFLYRHAVDKCWEKIYKAWTEGATIEVYSCIEIDEKLATVPSYADDPTALSPTSWDIIEGEEEGYSTNNFKVQDPYTDRDETAVRPTE